MYILEYKDGEKPEKLSHKAEANMERSANFLVEMIENYGKEVLERIEEEKSVKIRKSTMMRNEYGAVCECLANGAFSADRLIKA